MLGVYTWATRWNISPYAMQELLSIMGAIPDHKPDNPNTSEAGVQNTARTEAAKRYGSRLWRNNSGVAQTEDGRPVRYGLCNDSAQINKIIKSPDLVGVTPIRCSCGKLYGVFTGYECKKPGWTYRPSDERATAQLNFIKLVNSLGGIAKFITDGRDV